MSAPPTTALPAAPIVAADVALRDGSTVHVRGIIPEDAEPLLAFLEGLSPQSRMLRFFSAGLRLDRARDAAMDMDGVNCVGLVATRGPEGRIVGHAEYIREAPDRAEVAFEVADDYLGHGLGTIFLLMLAEIAERNGISTFEATVMAENHRMIGVFRDSGFPVELRSAAGEVHVTAPTSLSPEALAAFQQREQNAAVAAVEPILRPKSVAVLGASAKPGTVGGEILTNLLSAGFHGVVYAVNPNAGAAIRGLRAHASIEEVDGPVDLAVIAVPARAVLDAARSCARKGVRALVVVTAGFAETGPSGIARQDELLAICRESGMRIVGPNCLGVLCTDPEVSLNATFARAMPPAGPVGFVSQSGALGLAVMDRAMARGIGLSSFVSVGDRADISGNDLLEYWDSDESTGVALLYLESFGNPRKFARIARRLARKKPILVVKAGRTAAGARAAQSHTGALLAASDVTVDALCSQVGVIRADTLGELLDVTALLASQPLPTGNRVAIVTNAGGLGILCADACEASGLRVEPLPSKVRTELASFLPAAASTTNPVDMLATASAEEHARVLQVLAACEDVDAIVAIHIPAFTGDQGVTLALQEASMDLPREIPVALVLMEGGTAATATIPGAAPAFDFPEDAAHALARVARYAAWRREPDGVVPVFADADGEAAASVIAEVLETGDRWLQPSEVQALLGAYGVPLITAREASDPAGAAAAAQELGGPVALKAIAPGLVHKSDAGGVRLGLMPEEVENAAREMAADVETAGHPAWRYLVQKMAPPGVEMLVGVVNDPAFGPVLAIGAGGKGVELLGDVAARITPVTDRDVHEMLRELRTFPLLEGYRGEPPADLAALEDVVLRVGALVEAHAEVAELELNPVVCGPDGVSLVDARVRVAPAAEREPLAAVKPRRPAPPVAES